MIAMAFRPQLSRFGAPCGFIAVDFLARIALASIPLLAAAASPASLTLRVSSETAPPGGWTQIKVFASTPASVASASITMDLDPTVFSSITKVAAFSAAGDAMGYANVNGLHVDAHVSSASGTIGQTPELPVFAVWVPVFVGAQPGATIFVSLDPSGDIWKDAAGNPYSVMVIPGRFTASGAVSVRDVTPGGGLMTPGTILNITGSGFDAATTVTIEGLSLASQRVVNAGQIDVTVGASDAPAEMTGRRVRVAGVDHYASMPSHDPQHGWGVHVILPLQAFSQARLANDLLDHSQISAGLALANQNPFAVTVELFFEGGIDQGTMAQRTVVIPPAALNFGGVGDVLNPPGNYGGTLHLLASAPIRMLKYESVPPSFFGPGRVTVSPVGGPYLNAPIPPIQAPLSTREVSWNLAVGSPQPAAATVRVSGDLPFTVSVSSGAWLAVTPLQGTAPATLTITPNLAGLSPGTYSATVTVTPRLPAALPSLVPAPSTVTIDLTVPFSPLILSTAVPQFTAVAASPVFGNPQTFVVYSNGGPVAFRAAVTPGTGGNWLSVTPSSATTPAVLTLTADASNLFYFGRYMATVTLQGPANTFAIPVGIQVLNPPAPASGLAANPPVVDFILSSSAGSSESRLVAMQPASAALQVSVATRTGGNWLNAAYSSNAPGALTVTANSGGMPAGAYAGSVTVSSPGISSPLQIPVVLYVFDPPTPKTELIAKINGSGISLTSSDVAVFFSVEGARVNRADVLLPDGRARTNAELLFSVPEGLPPGIYRWNVVIRWAKGVITLPVEATVKVVVGAVSVIAYGIENAASRRQHQALAPGEIVTVYVQGLSDGTETNGTQVLMGGLPSPLLYVSTSQVKFTVPYETAPGQTTLQVVSGTARSDPVPVTVVPAAPGVFTVDMTGRGQAAVLNQDNTVNSEQNPAERGSAIQIFATGGGKAYRGTADLEWLVLPVSVTISGVEAPVEFAGYAPHLVPGLLQVNARVPAGGPFGSRVPLLLNIGGVESQSDVFIAVR
jgi:uncharacterized protein (TIGR03437 family)